MKQRQELIKSLEKERFDLLVIGGGATGAGIALDAISRGYHVALIEAGDFGSGASGNSTKLLHGGIRYLERALLHFEWSQMKFVRESLKEREIVFKIAPHLSHEIPIMLPFYHPLDRYYYTAGFKLYEWLAPSTSLISRYALSQGEVLSIAPFLKQQGLRGALVYHDGQFNDARLNLAIILTALRKGVCALNYTKLMAFVKEDERIIGAVVKDCLTGQKRTIKASLVVNATGSYADSIRLLDNSSSSPLLSPSVGTHIVLDKSIHLQGTGILIPETADGRVLFILPWEGKTLVGTTDLPADSPLRSYPTEREIDYLLEHLNKIVSIPLTRKNVSAAWSGIRPLCRRKNSNLPSARISRDHSIEAAPSGLYTIAGGKWTTYRRMAEDLLNRMVSDGKLSFKNPCTTATIFLVGGEHYYSNLGKEIAEKCSLEKDIAEHLAHSYGDQVEKVVNLAGKGLDRRLHPQYPYIEAEVVYAIRYEYAQKISDVIFRRTRLGSLDQQAALDSIPLIGQLMAEECGWTRDECQTRCAEAIANF